MRNLIALALVTVAASAQAEELSFGEPVAVNGYSVRFDKAIKAERVTEYAASAQTIPQLNFSASLFVAPRAIKGDTLALTAKLSGETSIVIFLDPSFNRQPKQAQEMIFTHELVHAKLLLMGLGDDTKCRVYVHEQIAHSVSVTLERNFDKAQAFRKHIGKLRDYVQAECGSEDYSKFYAEFSEFVK